MIFIHQSTCISPQHSFPRPDLGQLVQSQDNKMKVIEPLYEGIPAGTIRRMGKAVRIGVGAAIPLMQLAPHPAGIILGTANGGMEDCIKFLNQIIQYEEGMLTPGNFVQSTPNAIASQISLWNGNTAYNITHVHRGLAFENAILDCIMQVREHPSLTYLLGAVDEISTYNFNIDYLAGWYKQEPISNSELYQSNTEASIAGEGAAMFLVSGIAESALARLDGIRTLHGQDKKEVSGELKQFLVEHIKTNERIDLMITGENGDSRMLKYYQACQEVLPAGTGQARFKHMSGEYPTASAMALWLACQILQDQCLPPHMWKTPASGGPYNKILLYNNYKGLQHSFMLVSKVQP